MLIAPYMNDNPYRLLDLPSVTLQADLERAAETAANAAQIGIPLTTALVQVFGAERMPQCVEKVQALRTDPLERTVYRLFWPFDYQRRPEFKGTLADLLGSDELGPATSFRVLQLRFVISWARYLAKPSVVNMVMVLDAFDTLCKEDALYTFLSELLQKEGETAAQATDIGHRAPSIVLDRMLVVFQRQAVQWWENGESEALTDLVQKLPAAGFDESILDKVLPGVIAAADREADRIRALTGSFPGWQASQPPPEPAEFAKLRLLALALEGRTPAAQNWLQAVESRVRQVAGAMRQQALDLADRQNEQVVALNILAHIQTFPLPEDLERQIKADEARFLGVVEAREAEIWKDIQPMGDPPTLTTINGIGFTVYGHQPFAGDPDWYFKTYYFVFFFLPIIPIRRYLVADSPKGGWFFHASAPLTKFGKYHLGFSLGSLLLFFLYLVFFANRTPSSNYSSSTPYSYYNSTAGTGSSSSRNEFADTDPAGERKRLADEYDRLRIDVGAEKVRLDQREADLDRVSKKLDEDRKHVNRDSQRAIDAYNERLSSYRRTVRQYNLDIAAYNKHLKHLQEITKKLQKPGP